jgi:hypothetical protein
MTEVEYFRKMGMHVNRCVFVDCRCREIVGIRNLKELKKWIPGFWKQFVKSSIGLSNNIDSHKNSNEENGTINQYKPTKNLPLHLPILPNPNPANIPKPHPVHKTLHRRNPIDRLPWFPPAPPINPNKHLRIVSKISLHKIVQIILTKENKYWVLEDVCYQYE